MSPLTLEVKNSHLPKLYSVSSISDKMNCAGETTENSKQDPTVHT